MEECGLLGVSKWGFREVVGVLEAVVPPKMCLLSFSLKLETDNEGKEERGGMGEETEGTQCRLVVCVTGTVQITQVQ